MNGSPVGTMNPVRALTSLGPSAMKPLAATVRTSNATDYIAALPHACPHCGRMTTWFRNEDGRTRCINCPSICPCCGSRGTVTTCRPAAHGLPKAISWRCDTCHHQWNYERSS